MGDEPITTQVIEGISQESESQAVSPSPQGDEVLQDFTGAVVEGAAQSQPSTPESRPRPSTFYGDRKKVRELENTVTQLSQYVKDLMALPQKQSESGVKSDFDVNEFWSSPEIALKKMKEKWFQEWESTRLPEITKSQTQKQEIASKMQGALEIIFPKNGENDQSDPFERANANPEKLAAVNRILKVWGLNELSKTHPLEAAKLDLEKLDAEQKFKGKNTFAPTKGQMTSTSGSTQGGKRQMSPQEIKQEYERIMEMAREHPELLQDDEFVRRKKMVFSQAQELMKKG